MSNTNQATEHKCPVMRAIMPLTRYYNQAKPYAILAYNTVSKAYSATKPYVSKVYDQARPYISQAYCATEPYAINMYATLLSTYNNITLDDIRLNLEKYFAILFVVVISMIILTHNS